MNKKRVLRTFKCSSGYSSEHYCARPVRHAVAVQAARQGARLSGAQSSLPVSTRIPGRVRPVVLAHHQQQDDQRGDHPHRRGA